MTSSWSLILQRKHTLVECRTSSVELAKYKILTITAQTYLYEYLLFRLASPTVSAPDGLLLGQPSNERTHFDTNVVKDVQKLIINNL